MKKFYNDPILGKIPVETLIKGYKMRMNVATTDEESGELLAQIAELMGKGEYHILEKKDKNGRVQVTRNGVLI